LRVKLKRKVNLTEGNKKIKRMMTKLEEKNNTLEIWIE
jgi:hypothetical protein